jgi:glycosyltransferase involved in cell wall biosynthesis
VSLEAQATGTPVVTFNVGGLPETVQDGETGLVVREVNQQALTAALASLLADPRRLAAMSEKAATRIAHQFSWSIVIERLLRITEGE